MQTDLTNIYFKKEKERETLVNFNRMAEQIQIWKIK